MSALTSIGEINFLHVAKKMHDNAQKQRLHRESTSAMAAELDEAGTPRDRSGANLFQSGVIDPAKERESSGLSPRGPGVVCRRLCRQRRLYRRYAPHHVSMLVHRLPNLMRQGLRPSPQMPLAFSPLRHQRIRAMAAELDEAPPDARRLVCPAW